MQEIYDFHGLWYTPIWKTSWFLLIFVVFFIFFVFKFVVWLKHRPLFQSESSKPWVVAKSKLKKLANPNNCNFFYLSLIHELKVYFGLVYGLDCLGKTDKEFLDFFRATNFPEESLVALGDIFERANRAKFACKNFCQETMLEDLWYSIYLVNIAIPKDTDDMMN